ncbi:MAG: hypothetical protein CMM10_07900 [Rhodospirillaceae bacterium]|nr:hypothetical protein [Rhodospirillaceae bacterium]
MWRLVTPIILIPAFLLAAAPAGDAAEKLPLGCVSQETFKKIMKVAKFEWGGTDRENHPIVVLTIPTQYERPVARAGWAIYRFDKAQKMACEIVSGGATTPYSKYGDLIWPPQY